MKFHPSFLFLFFLFLVLTLISATEICPSTNQFDFSIVPCEGITPIIGNCTNFNYTIIDLNDANRNVTANLTIKSPEDNLYNFSFPFDTNSSYQIRLCDNSTATVTVGEFKQFYSQQTYIQIFAFLLGLGLLIAGYTAGKEFFVFIGGMLFTILGLFIFINGIAEVTSQLLNNAIYLILTFGGIYFMIIAYWRRDQIHGNTN